MSMVIGQGTIADRFMDYTLQSDYLIYAGDINDSEINVDSAIQKEEESIKLNLQKYPAATFVYFSSCSLLDNKLHSTPYIEHKARMESLIKNSENSFLIIRLPQFLGLNTAKSNLANFLVNAITSKIPFNLWSQARKNFIDIDDVHEIVGEILKKKKHLNKVINIANPESTPVLDVVKIIEELSGVSAIYKSVNEGSSYDIDISEITPILKDLNINFDKEYLKKTLRKYFNHLWNKPNLISIIVPTYNEEHGIGEFYRRVKAVMSGLVPRFNHEIIFVNDFSTDNTYKKLEELAEKDPMVKLINFSRNFGNQIAITAGMDHCRGDLAVIIDDDLQDPPEIILNFISKWEKGYKVVYGVRPKRQGVGLAFKLITKLYYRVISSLSDIHIPNDTGDFRLIDRVVINTLKTMREENRYYRGLVSWVGFSQKGVVYKRDKRYAGSSTFSFKKYYNFAVNGLTSFTEKPLYFSSIIGLIITFISFILAVTLVVSKMLDSTFSIRGWTSLMVIVLFFGGIQLLSTGVLGVYISKIYREVKGRPLYIIESTTNIKT